MKYISLQFEFGSVLCVTYCDVTITLVDDKWLMKDDSGAISFYKALLEHEASGTAIANTRSAKSGTWRVGLLGCVPQRDPSFSCGTQISIEVQTKYSRIKIQRHASVSYYILGLGGKRLIDLHFRHFPLQTRQVLSIWPVRSTFVKTPV